MKKSLAALALSLLVACQSQQESTRSDPEDIRLPDQEGWNSTVISTDRGRISAKIQYGHMRQYSKRQMVYFDQGVTVDFFNPEGQHTSRATAERGALNEATNDVEALGHVVVASDSGITLFTEAIRWDHTQQRILSDMFVTVTTAEHDTLYGVGFESDQSLANWVIKKPTGVTEKKVDIKRLQEPKGQEPAVATEDSVRALFGEPPDSLRED